MGSFENSPDTWERLDWKLLQNGFATLFMGSREGFTATTGELAGLGYLVIELDAGAWETTEDALLAFGNAFSFPDYYGENMNALVDCLSDVARFDYGSDPTSTGTAVALDRLDVLFHRDPDLAWRLTDILADTARQALLIGHRFIVMARTDDPHLQIEPVGATRVARRRI